MFKENFAFQSENKTEKKESRQEKMDKLLIEMSNHINEDLTNFIPEYRNFKKKIVNEDGSINHDAFSRGREAGPYQKSNGKDGIKDDKNFIHARYMDWSGLENPKVQSHYKNEFGCKTEEEMLEKYIENREKENGIILEKALTLLLHRYLGQDYFVLRTATYDDFANGVDNLIINKKTGEVICAFDGLNEEFDNERRNQKLQKVIKKTKAGGAQIKYGLTIKNGELEKTAMENLPVFYLALNKNELNSLLNALETDLHAAINNQEEEIITKLLNTFEEQIQLLYQENIPEIMIDKLSDFEKTLNHLQKK